MNSIRSFFMKSLFVSVLSVGGLSAKELAGVELEEVVNLSLGGETVRLKGVASSGAHQSLYIGGLYLQNDSQSVEEILSNNGAKRFVLYCQDSTIKPGALIRAFNLGINANHTATEVDQLAPQIEQFNQIWKSEIKQGDKVWIDFLPNKGTVVTINGEERGIIEGKDFYDAFLKTWLGEKPINANMKKQLLGEPKVSEK